LTSTTFSPAADVPVADNSTIKPSIERSYAMIRVDFEGLSGSIDCPTHTLISSTTGRGQCEICTNKGSFLREAVKSVLLSEDSEVIVRLKDGKNLEMDFENREDDIAVASDLAA
jgi:hypothetical protein